MKTKMISLLVTTFLFLTCLSVTSGKNQQSNPKSATPTRDTSMKSITGGFIQYQGWMIKNGRNPTGLDERAWENEIEAMRTAKMDTIIIQRLEADGESFIPAADDRSAVDPTEVILKYADRHGMKVYLGLWAGPWDQGQVEKADPVLLANTRDNSFRVADAAWKRYGGHRSFAGWYIQQEIWNIAWEPAQNERMRTFFREVSDYCKGLGRNNKPVAISPYFNPEVGASEEDEVAGIYTLFLKGSDSVKGAGVDILMLQDGVGARCWKTKDEIEGNVRPFFRAFYRATQAAGVELWGNIETFRTVAGGCIDNYSGRNEFTARPTDVGRLKSQLEVASVNFEDGQPTFKKLVTFDFFHYMSPLHGCNTSEERRRLHSDYLKLFQ